MLGLGPVFIASAEIPNPVVKIDSMTFYGFRFKYFRFLTLSLFSTIMSKKPFQTYAREKSIANPHITIS